MPVAAPLIAVAGSAILGHQSSQAAKGAANATETRPFSGTSSLGTTKYNQGNRTFDINQANNPFAQLSTIGGLSQFANAYSAPGQAYYGAPQEVINALQGTMDPSQLAQQRLDMLRQQASPENNRQALALKDKLFSLGQLGSTSGAEGQRAFLEAQNAQDLGFQQSAQDYANTQAQNRFQNAIQATGLGANLANQNFSQGVGANNILSQQFQNLLSQAQLGVQAGGGQAPGAAVNAANQPSTGQLLGTGLLPGLQNLANGEQWGGGLSEIKMPAYNP